MKTLLQNNYDLLEGTKIRRIATEVFGEERAKYLINGGFLVPGKFDIEQDGKKKKTPIVSFKQDDGHYVDYNRYFTNDFVMNGFETLAIICSEASGFGAVDFDTVPVIDEQMLANVNVKTSRENGYHIWFDNKGGYYRGATKGYDILADKNLCVFWAKDGSRTIHSNQVIYTVEEICEANNLDLSKCVRNTVIPTSTSSNISSTPPLTVKSDVKNEGKSKGKNVYQVPSVVEVAESLGYGFKKDWFVKNRINSMKGCKEGNRNKVLWGYSCQFVASQLDTGDLELAAVQAGLSPDEVAGEIESARNYVENGLYISTLEYAMGWMEFVVADKKLGCAQLAVAECLMTSAIEQQDLKPLASQEYIAEQTGMPQGNVSRTLKNLHMVRGLVIPQKNGMKETGFPEPYNYQLSVGRKSITDVLEHDAYLMRLVDEGRR